MTSAMRVRSVNHWTTGEFPGKRPFNFLAKSLDPTSTLGMFSFLSDLPWFHPLEIPDYGMWSSKWPQDRESCNSKEQASYHTGGIITQSKEVEECLPARTTRGLEPARGGGKDSGVLGAAFLGVTLRFSCRLIRWGGGAVAREMAQIIRAREQEQGGGKRT